MDRWCNIVVILATWNTMDTPGGVLYNIMSWLWIAIVALWTFKKLYNCTQCQIKEMNRVSAFYNDVLWVFLDHLLRYLTNGPCLVVMIFWPTEGSAGCFLILTFFSWTGLISLVGQKQYDNQYWVHKIILFRIYIIYILLVISYKMVTTLSQLKDLNHGMSTSLSSFLHIFCFFVFFAILAQLITGYTTLIHISLNYIIVSINAV